VGVGRGATVRYALLGPVELRDGWESRQAALLALLLVNATRALLSDRMIDVMWSD
jgi:DNA-binding SARP family transcriptional activator